MLSDPVPYRKACSRISEAHNSIGIKTISNQEPGEAGTLRKEDLVLLIEWLKPLRYGKKEVRKLFLYSGTLRKCTHLIWGSPCD